MSYLSIPVNGPLDDLLVDDPYNSPPVDGLVVDHQVDISFVDPPVDRRVVPSESVKLLVLQ